jgi:hypothetical protein
LRIEQDILQIKLRASEAVLAEAQEMAHAGNWDIDLVAKSFCRKRRLVRRQRSFGLAICLRSDTIFWNLCQKGDSG